MNCPAALQLPPIDQIYLPLLNSLAFSKAETLPPGFMSGKDLLFGVEIPYSERMFI
jgi:hypothetical protein